MIRISNMKHKRTKFGQATTGRLLAVAAMLCLTAKGASAQADHKTLFSFPTRILTRSGIGMSVLQSANMSIIR